MWKEHASVRGWWVSTALTRSVWTSWTALLAALPIVLRRDSWLQLCFVFFILIDPQQTMFVIFLVHNDRVKLERQPQPLSQTRHGNRHSACATTCIVDGLTYSKAPVIGRVMQEVDFGQQAESRVTQCKVTSLYSPTMWCNTHAHAQGRTSNMWQVIFFSFLNKIYIDKMSALNEAEPTCLPTDALCRQTSTSWQVFKFLV